ncbi:MAG: sigma-70 family RNA polymerase sigma factor [Kiloniellales bacterium]|nr:sigma-70 family RNA polymerase sigma factor [Kiloniellales bacterium]
MPNPKDSVLEHISGLRRYALRLSGNSVDADDLVQESLSRALMRQRKNAEIRNLRAYLFSVLHNTHVDRMAERRRWHENVTEAFLENSQFCPASQPDRLALYEVAKALDAMPEEQRHALLLVGYEGLSYKESAAILGVPVGTVMSRLSRARDTLRRLTNRAPAGQAKKRRRRKTGGKPSDPPEDSKARA